MKFCTALLLALASFIFITSCSKNSPAALSGKWELRQTMSDMGIRNYNTGNGITMEITGASYLFSDTAYTYFVGMASSKQGSCKIVPDASASETTGLNLAPGFDSRIIFNDDKDRNKAFFKLHNDTLTIISGFFPTDGGIELKLVR